MFRVGEEKVDDSSSPVSLRGKVGQGNECEGDAGERMGAREVVRVCFG